MASVLLVDTPTTLRWTSSDATAATVAVTKPDGTAVSPAPTVTDAATGHTAPFTPDAVGQYKVLWRSTGDSYTTTLEVWPETPRMLISHDVAAAQLGGIAGNLTRDELTLYVSMATLIIEWIVGTVLTKSSTYVTDGGREAIALPDIGVSVSSVTVSGTALTSDDFVVNAAAGVVYAKSGMFATGSGQNVSIVYTSGSSAVPANLQMACRELVAHIYRSGVRSGRPGAQAAPQDTIASPFGFAIPRRVVEMCQATTHTPGFG